MRRLLALILLLFYTASATGMVATLHYCGGSLKSVSLSGQEDEEGCCGSKKKSDGCCSNKVIKVKKSDNHDVKHFVFATKAFEIPDLPPVLCSNGDANLSGELTEVFIPVSHSPPISPGLKLYLLHRVLLI